MRPLLPVLLLLSTPILYGQAAHFFRQFTEKDGLSSDFVTCVLRDRDGFLWVGTNYGLNRYDGRTFRHFLPDARAPEGAVSNEYITALAQDDSGFVWIATRNGLNRYDPRAGTFAGWQNTGRTDGSLPSSMISGLLPDGPLLWLACDNRDLACLDRRTGAFHTYPWKKFAESVVPAGGNRPYRTIYAIRFKSADTLWLHTNLGVFDFDKKNRQFSFYPIDRQNPASCPVDETVFFFGSWDDDVWRLHPGTRCWSRVPLPLDPARSNGFRRVVRVERAGRRHWVLSQPGLFTIDAATGRVELVRPDMTNRFSAPNGLLEAFWAEPDGTLWFGGERGLWQLDPRLQHFAYTALDTTPFASLANRFARVVDAQGRRFVTDLYRGRLLVLENGAVAHTIALNGPAEVLQTDGHGRLWVTGGARAFRLDPQTLTLEPFPLDENLLAPGPKTTITGIAEDAGGNWWFTTSDRGALLYSPREKRWRKPGPADGFSGENLACIFADTARRTVWIGSFDYGLFRYNEASGDFTRYRHDERNRAHSLGAYMVRAICRDGLGHIWLATDPGGLSRFEYDAPPGREFTTLDTRDGLPSNQVCALLADARGNVWAGTTKGLAWVDARTLRLRAWGKASGLRNPYIDLPLSAGADGRVVFGGAQGYEYFHPDSLLAGHFDARILLTSFKVFDRERIGAVDSSVTLPWRDNFFSIEFSSANFSRPDANEFFVRLRDFDADWKACGARGYAAWTNVPPGDYELQIRAGDGHHEPGPIRRLAVHIAPPFWQTGWFRFLALGGVVVLVGGIYQYRVGQIRRTERLKTEFDRRLARVEMSALRAQMNPHFVFNCLNSINRFILVNEPDVASRYLTKFSRLIRLIFDNSRSETVLLEKEIDALRLYLEMEAMRFDGRFDFDIAVDPALEPAHLEVPPLLIQPFVENAVWHGLMHRKTRGALRIRVYPGPAGGLRIDVEDNGVGRARARELKSKSAQRHKSQGLQVTSERLDIIRILYGVDAAVEIDDLFAPDGTPAGTRVRLRLDTA